MIFNPLNLSSSDSNNNGGGQEEETETAEGRGQMGKREGGQEGVGG